MHQAAYTELTNIVERTSQNRFLPPGDYRFLDGILRDMKTRTLSVNADSALPLIKELKDSLSKVEYREIWPFLYLFIAYANFHLNDLHAARISAQDAVRKFISDDMNLVLSRWFLATIYREEGYIKDAKEQLEYYALKTLSRIIIQTHDDDIGWKVKRECHLWNLQIKSAIANLPQTETRLFATARRDQRERFPFDGAGNSGGDTSKPPEDESVRKNDVPPINMHVDIPIDIRSTDRIDQKSTQYSDAYQEQRSKQAQEAVSATSTPMDLHRINVEMPSLNHPEDSEQPVSSKQSSLPIDVSELSYLMTPGFPIYGKASAGINGQVVLAPPNYDGTIDESRSVQIEGKEYKLVSIKQDDNQINISYDDFYRSLTPQNKNHEQRGKRYGWLKVVGTSMNNARPHPIENDDFVLFFENRSPRDGQIVIASLPTHDSQHMPLVVKRLKKINSRIILRSESCDENIIYADIEIPEEHLIGEIVANAKPIAIQ